MPENHDNQNMAVEIWINAEGQENHVCMWVLYHGSLGSRVVTFFSGYVLGNRVVGRHTEKGEF